MKAEYFMVLGLTVLLPVVLSFDRKLRFYRNPAALLKSMTVVCVPFWAWDVLATARGHWWFNRNYTVGASLIGLPVEEWVFFVVISFVSIFTWEVAKYFAGRRR